MRPRPIVVPAQIGARHPRPHLGRKFLAVQELISRSRQLKESKDGFSHGLPRLPTRPLPSPRPLAADLTKLKLKPILLVLLVALVALGLARHLAGPALAHLQLLLEMTHGLSFARRAYHFPSANSFNAWLSSDRSATSRFSRAFSSFKALYSRTVSTSAPPYSFCHR